MSTFYKFFVVFMLVVLIAGCASKEQVSKENTKTEKAVQETQGIKAKVEEMPPVMTEVKKETEILETKIPSPVLDVPVKVEAPVVVKEASPLVTGDTRWILVFKTNELIEPQEREDILVALKERWLKDKPHQEIAAKDFDIEKLIGRIVVLSEARRAYGKYEFTIRTGKMIQDGKDIVEEPLSKEQGPDCIIDNRESVESLIREIKFAE